MTGPRCGKETGYQDHLRGGTEPCTACRRAHADKRAEYRRRRYLNHAPLSVDATSTRRRIQALAAIGWSLAEQSRRLGVNETMAHRYYTRKWVVLETASKVRALYDELSMIPGTNQRAKNEAAKRGWPPPLAWDDDTIDDPSARPSRRTSDRAAFDEIAVQRAMRGARVHLRPVERAEAVRRLTDLRLSAEEIAARLHLEPRSVTRHRKAIREANTKPEVA